MKKVFVIAILVFSIIGCSSYPHILTTKEEMKTLMNNNEYIILDVRTKEEYSEGHIIDAINIPYDNLNKDTSLDKDKIIFVYCRSGNRSKIAFDTLTKLGYKVYDLGSFSKIELPKE